LRNKKIFEEIFRRSMIEIEWPKGQQ
jgi:hypothetical protein